MMASKGADPIKLGQWMWVLIKGKAGESAVFVSAYCPCQSKKGMDTVWNQHVQYYQHERLLVEKPDVHSLFTADRCRALGNLRDFGHHVVFGMDANNDIRDGVVTSALLRLELKKLS